MITKKYTGRFRIEKPLFESNFDFSWILDIKMDIFQKYKNYSRNNYVSHLFRSTWGTSPNRDIWVILQVYWCFQWFIIGNPIQTYDISTFRCLTRYKINERHNYSENNFYIFEKYPFLCLLSRKNRNWTLEVFFRSETVQLIFSL